MCVSVIGQVRTVDIGRAEIGIDVDGRPQRASLVVLELEGIAVAPGDWVHVHTGFAVAVLDPAEAIGLITEQREARAVGDLDATDPQTVATDIDRAGP